MNFRAGREPWCFNKIILWLSKDAADVASSPYIEGDGTDVVLSGTSGDFVLADNFVLAFGAGKDLEVASDGTDVTFTVANALSIEDGTGSLSLGVGAAGAWAMSDGTAELTMDGAGAVSLNDGTGYLTMDGAGASELSDGVGAITMDGAGAISINDGVAGIDLDGSGAVVFDAFASLTMGCSGDVALTVGGNTSLSTPGYLDGLNALSSRYALKWVAGERGLVATNASAAYTVDFDFEAQGTNASDDDITMSPLGGLSLETDGADGDEVILWPHQTHVTPWDDVQWDTDAQVIFETDIVLGADIANYIGWAGLKLTNTEVKATDADQVYFRFEDDVAAGNWEVVYTNTADTLVSMDTGVTAVAGTRYHLKLAVQADRTVLCYINSVLVATTNALDAATALKPVIGVAADGAAAAKGMGVLGAAISRVVA